LLVQLGLSVVVQAGSIATLACAGAALGLSLAGWVWVSAAVPVFVMAMVFLILGLVFFLLEVQLAIRQNPQRYY
jgi:hypothetical protein